MKPFPVSRTANSNLQMKINISVIFNYLRQYGSSYRAKISKDLKISAPAVSRAIDKLIEKGYVIEQGKIKTESGKFATQVSLNLNKGSVLGIDLLSDKIRMGVCDFNGKLLEIYSGMRLSESKNIREDLINEVSNFLSIIDYKKKSGKKIPELQSICAGIPAIVDADSGDIISAYLYESLRNINFKKILEQSFGVTAFVENIVNLCAFGEKRFGKGKEYENLVFIDISNGIGAGIILENNLIRGTLGGAGEIGYSILSRENLDHQNITTGYLEEQASVEGIKLKAIEEIKKGNNSKLQELCNGNINQATANMVFKLAAEGDNLSKEIVTQAVEMITVIVLNIILLLNPSAVIFGGDICGLDHVDSLFIQPMRKRIGAVLPFSVPEIILSNLGENAGIIGASVLAIETLLTNQYPYKIEDL